MTSSEGYTSLLICGYCERFDINDDVCQAYVLALTKMTLSIYRHLSSINSTLFATSQNSNSEISVKLLYLFVEFISIVKLIIPMKVIIDTPHTHFSQKILYPPLEWSIAIGRPDRIVEEVNVGSSACLVN